MSKFYRTEVQKALVAAAMAGVFPSVVYDPTTHAPSTGANVLPAEALANETDGTYGQAAINRRTQLWDRVRWSFELKLGFNQEVITEQFEAVLTQGPLKVLRDAANGIPRQVELHITSVRYSHPAQQQPSTGTQVIYTFNAVLSPL